LISIISSSHDSSFSPCFFAFFGDKGFGHCGLATCFNCVGDFSSSSDSLEDEEEEEEDDPDEEVDEFDDPEVDDDDEESLSEEELESSPLFFFVDFVLAGSFVLLDAFFLVELILSFLSLSKALLFPFFFGCGFDSKKAAIFCGGCCIISSHRLSITFGSSSSCSTRVLTSCRIPSIMISSL
jgi:hypothetical protein